MTEDAPPADDPPTDDAPADDPLAGDDAPGEADPSAGARDDEAAPMSDLAREVRERRRRRDRDDADDDPFESMDVGELDSEAVWESLADAETDAPTGESATEADAATEQAPSAEATGVGVGVSANRVEGSAGRPEYVVPKTDFCQQCSYLSDPPELACGHEGSEIVAVVDSEQFRISGCPFVDRDPESTMGGRSQAGGAGDRAADDRAADGEDGDSHFDADPLESLDVETPE